MNVCLFCLNIIDNEDIVIQNRSETYHTNCHSKLLCIRERKNKLKEDIIDVTDSLVLDSSENPITLNYPWPDELELIEELKNSTSNETTLKNFGYLDNNIINEINNIFSGPDFATDYAGNQVKLDKKYIANHKLKSMGVKYKF